MYLTNVLRELGYNRTDWTDIIVVILIINFIILTFNMAVLSRRVKKLEGK